MLHWLRKKLLKTLWRRLAAISLTLHLLLLAALFLSGESSEHQSLDLSKVYDPQAKIVLLPFYRVVPAELNQRRGGGGSAGSGGVGSSNGRNATRTKYTLTGAGRPATTLVYYGQSPAEKRAAEKKRQAEKKRIAKARAEKKAQLIKKQQAKKRRLEEKRAHIKEAARKKLEKKQKIAEEKKARAQEKLEQAKREKEALEQAKKEKNEKFVGKMIENPSVQVPVNENSVNENSSNERSSNERSANGVSGEGGSGDGSENIIYVGRDEIDQYRENTELRDALAAVWHPPLGIEPDEPCKLAVVVDANGSAQTVTIEASSGILVYDSAAQAALYETTFPERQQGKVLHITFR